RGAGRRAPGSPRRCVCHAARRARRPCPSRTPDFPSITFPGVGLRASAKHTAKRGLLEEAMAPEPAEALPETPAHTMAMRDASRWFALAISSIAVAGTLAIVLVIGRLPGISEIVITDIEFAKRSLVVHVNLALAVWFFSFSAGLFCMLPGVQPMRFTPVAWALATIGTLLFCSTI